MPSQIDQQTQADIKLLVKVLERIKRIPNTNEYLQDNKVKIDSYVKGWFSKKKVLDVTIAKAGSNSGMCTINVIENSVPTYRTTFEYRLFRKFLDEFREWLIGKYREAIESEDRKQETVTADLLRVNNKILDTADLIEQI